MKLSEIYTELTLHDKDYDLKIHKATKTSQTFAQRVQKKFDGINLKRAALAIAAFATATAYSLNRWVIKPFIGAADAAEQYMIRLSTLLRSQAEGNRLFQEMQKYAAKVPFTFMNIMESVTSLAGIMKGGVNEIKEWVPMIGDLAAAYGMTFRDTTSQIIRMYSAGAAAADMFREKGVSTMMGFQAGVAYTAEETRRMIMQSWTKMDSQFAGATAKLAKTWSGLMSQIRDAWDLFKIAVMEAGIFEYLKNKVQNIIDTINKFRAAGTLDDLAKTLSDKIVTSFEKMASYKDDLIAIAKAFGQLAVNLVTIGDWFKNIYLLMQWSTGMRKQFLWGGQYPETYFGGGTARGGAGAGGGFEQGLKMQLPPGGNVPLRKQTTAFKAPYYFGKAPMVSQYPGAYPGLGGFPGAGMGMKRTYESQLLGLQTATKTAAQEISSQWKMLSWSMQSSWSYTMENMMRGGMSFGNFMKNMFMDVYNSYARMISNMVAERLYERTFKENYFLGEAIETGLSLIGLGKKTAAAPSAGKAAIGNTTINNYNMPVEGASAEKIIGIVYEDMDRNGLLSR